MPYRLSLFLSLMIILLFVCFYYISNSNFFKLKHIYISYIPSYQVEEIYWSSQINALKQKWQSLKGKNLWYVSVSHIKKELSSKPWIKEFQVQRKWPDELKILLKTQKILAVEVNDQALAIPFSQNGDSLPPSSLTQSPFAPVLRYSQHSPLQNKQIRTKLAHFLSYLPDQGYLSLSHIDEVTIEQDQIWLHLLKEKIKIRLGQRHLPVRIARVEKVLEYLKSQGIANRTIDAGFSDKVLVTSNNESQ